MNELRSDRRPLFRDATHAIARLLACALVAATAQTALADEPALPQPVDVVFVLDNSGSMKANDPEFLTRRAVSNFVDALAADATLDGRVALVLFDGRARLAQALAPASDIASTRALAATLASLDYSGQRTDSPAGIERALYELRERGRDEARKAIVFLSDGRIDTGDPRNDVEVARWLREDLASESAEGDVRIFGIAFTDDADYQLMQALARRTNARYYRAFAAGELAPVVKDVLGKIAAEPGYELAYIEEPVAVPTPDVPDVAAAPMTNDAEPGGSGLLGWLPVAVLLLGVGYAIQRRRAGAPLLGVAGMAKAPAAQLLDIGGQAGDAGRALPLATARTTIGRDPNNGVVLDDDTISSEHAAIEVRDGRYWLEDLRSTNGTRLGDRRLADGERLPLKGGDHVRFADVDMMFVVEGYVPGGATVYLSSSTTPPADWSVFADAIDGHAAAHVETPRDAAPPSAADPDAPSGEVAFAEQRERIDPAEVVDLDDALEGAAPTDEEESVEDPSATAVDRAESALAAVDDDASPAPDATPKRPTLELVTTPPDANEVEPTLDEPIPTPDEEATELFANEVTTPGDEPIDLDATTEIPLASVARAREEEPARNEAVPETNDDEPAIQPGEATGTVAARRREMTLAPTAAPLGECLDYHLARVAEISPPFHHFIERAFPDDLRQALPVTALELIEAARSSGGVEVRAYTRDRIRYVVCGVAGPMDGAREHFVEGFGGFTRVLTEQLQDESFTRDRCEILALLTCGFDEQPWVSLSIVPDDGQDPRIDLLSYEFLTEPERREIEPNIDPEISQSGLA